MARRDNTKVQWVIQCRTSRNRPWRNRAGRFETRRNAREVAVELREMYGFGNTKAVPYMKSA